VEILALRTETWNFAYYVDLERKEGRIIKTMQIY
jgi:hypothetical protein